MSGPKPGRCRSCGAPIVWALTPSGARMPLDAQPSHDGSVLVAGYATGELRVVPREPGAAGVLYRSHFATCEFADAHRRKR